MCGIFGYIGQNGDAAEAVLAGLKLLEYRGYDSWGIAVKNGTTITLEKHTGKINNTRTSLPNSTIGLGHTRWATHGGVTTENAHPHLDCSKRIAVVHNGIVENFTELKTALSKKGHIFLSDTDSEVIAHLLEERLKKTKDTRQAVMQTFQYLEGMNAMMVFFADTQELFALKNGSPLVYGKGEKELILASDPSALSAYTNQVYFLEDHELLHLTSTNKVTLLSLQGQEKEISFVKLTHSFNEVQKGKYEHFMVKEMTEQPLIIENIALTQKEVIKEAADLVKKSYGTYLLGCGSAYYASLAGTYLFSKIAKKHINASFGSEFPYFLDFLKEKSLIIALSQSGETIDITTSISKAKEKGAKVMALTNVLGSTLYRIADHKLLLTAGPEKCVLATKSFTAKITFLYLIAHMLAGSFEEGTTQIQKAVVEIKKLLKQKKQFQKLAEYLKHKQHIYILGRGASFPTALEAALKIKEVSYIHAEGFAAGELKHGVIALIEEGTPVIVYNPEDETYKDTLSAAHEVKARGAYIIGISSKKNSIYDTFIKVGDCKDATIIPHVVAAQLLAYYLALALNLDPDKPRNLAKSVTVK